MKRSDGNRPRLGALVLAVAISAAAMLALPALGIGHDQPRGGDPAGTVDSFDPATGQLVIDLTNGGTISALVTPRTHLRCGDEGRRRHGHGLSHRHGDDNAFDGGPGRGRSEGSEDRPPRGPGDDDFPAGNANDPAANDDNPGDDDNPGEHNNHAARCSDQLVPGAIVRGAEVVLIDGGAFYKDVGLAPAATTPAEDN